MVKLDLLENEFLVLGNLEAEQLEVKVEVAHWVTSRLIILEVQTLHIGVLKSLIDGDSAVGVEREHLLNQVDGLVIGAPEQLIEVFAAVIRQLAHESSIVRILDLVDERWLGLANQVSDHHHLFLLSLRGKQGLAAYELGENAANAPNVDRRRVLSPGEDDLGGAVPACGDVVREGSLRRHQGLDVGARKPKVTDLQIAVAVDQEITRLQVTMKNSARVNVLEPAQDLVQEKLDVLVAEHLIRFDNLGKVSLHQVRNYVQLVELLQRLWLQDALDRKHVLVGEQAHDLELTERAQSENFVLERFFNFFDCDQVVILIFNSVVFGSHDDTVSA
mmetsp:Transcript_17459/g.23554  ORF Transcript_17459/g.23554 Transcript_17459/m.23554 type:complete len:332 (+) Transcript_17459:378-1373(+)|eukprot:CAMPEP_0185578622 /NCGR_PEP_ID=MMETSP0434-20130131/13045_1 /TAXON_ID=626734 ORGANISM="Favella taraikaensis, Strain Fe Narragansett Bay" /NCGR_SAMPLE_ID=MMETSP0434 /ASSEMBLY_ACC=CAM_ASM_000379 /LENGTH=331 /DNA_ID=CAMNT_0028196467 /DNA_START=376 /DNA_END=1371 /DNA_ORIENTATION=-